MTRVLAIPLKRADKRLVGYLTRAEMDAILDVPDRKTWGGQRDYMLLLTFYNSGARVSEITSLKRSQVRLGATSFLQLHGKGRKEREVPLWPKTARTLKLWLDCFAGIARQPGVSERTRHAVVAGRRQLHLAGNRAGSGENLPYTFLEANLAARASSHDGDASAAIRSRRHRDRPLARA